jgi:DNA-binding Lrp family transcriptional regulator
MKFTKKDIQIISRLRNNSREMLTKMSKETGIPISTIFDRINMQKEEILIKHTSLINFQAVGFNSRAKVILKVDKKDRERLKSFIEKSTNINSAYRINSGYDFMFEAIFKNMKDLEDFISFIEETHNILGKQVYYVIDDIKREEFLSQKTNQQISS